MREPKEKGALFTIVLGTVPVQNCLLCFVGVCQKSDKQATRRLSSPGFPLPNQQRHSVTTVQQAICEKDLVQAVTRERMLSY